MTPRQSLYWELNRHNRPELRWRPVKRASTATLVMLACGLALLAGVAFRILDSWVRW